MPYSIDCKVSDVNPGRQSGRSKKGAILYKNDTNEIVLENETARNSITSHQNVHKLVKL